jgi:hypothetical protein
MGFFHGETMAGGKKPGARKSARKKETDEPKSKTEPQKRVNRRSLMKKAYERVQAKLDGDESSKAIDDLVKLMKLEKDISIQQADVKEIKVRWEHGGEKSSSEE